MYCLTARPDRGSLWREEQKVPAILDILRSISSVHFCRGGHVSIVGFFFFPEKPSALNYSAPVSAFNSSCNFLQSLSLLFQALVTRGQK